MIYISIEGTISHVTTPNHDLHDVNKIAIDIAMANPNKSWLPGIISFLAIVVFGSMSLACLELEGLDPEIAEIFWDYLNDPIPCDDADPVTGSTEIAFVAEDAQTHRPLEFVKVTCTFSFYSLEWTGDTDDQGNSICLRTLQNVETHTFFLDQVGSALSQGYTWDSSEDKLEVSVLASKNGYTSYSETFTISYPGLAITVRTIRLASLDQPNP